MVCHVDLTLTLADEEDAVCALTLREDLILWRIELEFTASDQRVLHMLVVDADNLACGARVDENLPLHLVVQLWREERHKLLELLLAVEAVGCLLQIVPHFLLNAVWNVEVSHRGICGVDLFLDYLQLAREGLSDDGDGSHQVRVDETRDEEEYGAHNVGDIVEGEDVVAGGPKHRIVECQ